MLADIIKYYSLFYCCIYIITKTLKPFIAPLTSAIYNFIFPFFLSLIAHFCFLYITEATYIVPLTLTILTLNYFIEQPKRLFCITIYSFVISYCFLSSICFILTLIIYQIYRSTADFPYLLLIAMSSFFHLILTNAVLRIRRFKKGLSFLINVKLLNITTTICLTTTIVIASISPTETSYPKRLLMFISFTCIFIFLIYWWQAQITKSYKQALINRELESLRMELKEKEKQLAEVSARNEELGRLIHKDNKRIPAMEHAVSEFLVMDLDDKEKAIERANTLLIEIHKLSDDRNHMVTEIYARKYKHHDYGISELDNMLNYMEKRAYGEHIKLSVQTAINFHDFVPKNISAEDLSHVLSDLLENAIIAAKHSSSPVIQLQFYQAGKDFVIEIADNGIPFEAASLVNFGLEQLTTHADTGGSGIGLMDIWKIKEKYGVSLHITEYNSDAPYSKKIALIFNKKNRYTISTERKEELLALSKRTDLQIF